MSEQKKKKGGGQIYLSKISPLEIALSIRHLSLMIKSGLSLPDAIKIIAENTPDERLSKIYHDVSEELQSGKTLASALRKYPKVFLPVVTSIIEVGEQGGTLEDNLVFLADYLKKRHDMNKKISGALFYPIIIFVITLGEMLGMVFFILPKLETLFSSFDNVPAFTITIMNVSGFIRHNLHFIAAGLFIVVMGLVQFFKTTPGKKIKDKITVNFPVIKKLTINSSLANFSRTLGILLESGIALSAAMKITVNAMENSEYARMISDVRAMVKEGKNLGDSLTKYPKFFPATFVKMIAIGEKTGALESNLKYLYDYYSDEVDNLVNNITVLIEPFLLVFAGAMIGLLAMSVVGPIYQLSGSITE